MSFVKKIQSKVAALGIVFFCFGYFAAYVPYSMLTKMATRGLFSGMNGKGFNGFQIQPVAVLASAIGMFTFLTVAGWWKHATHSKVLGVSVPRPQWFTFLSGMCTGGIIVTTTLAYTIKGVSIVFAMLLMRGGVLVMAPIIDLIAVKRKRKVYWPSWGAAIMSFGALLIAFLGKTMGSNQGFIENKSGMILAFIDIGLYLCCYFIRFFIMSNHAKSADAEEKKRYFTEEQMTANFAIIFIIGILSLIGSQMKENSVPGMLWYGVTVLPTSGYFWHIILLGFLSYGTGLFGSLIFLDKREHTFTAPANRASSIMSGVIATSLLGYLYTDKYPSTFEFIGVALIIGAIFFLTIRAVIDKKKQAQENQ